MKSPDQLQAVPARSSIRPAGAAAATLLVVSNRLPYDIGRGSGPKHRNVGGLVNALEPAFLSRGGTWFGWDGISLPNARAVEDALASPHAFRLPSGVDLCGVPLSERDVARYYNGLCNRSLWPILHDFTGKGVFDPDDWERYVRVNRRFADVVLARSRAGDRIWVHDFQLFLVPRFLREGGFRGRIDFFLHTPFPPSEIFRTIPWREEIVRGLLACDTAAFHIPRYRDNFAGAAAALVSATASPAGANSLDLTHAEGATRIAAEPIGIDVPAITSLAGSRPVQARARRIRAAYGERPIVFGAERLDYTKGILERLYGVERLLRLRPETIGSFVFVQVVVPSRHVVEEYRRMKRDIDREVGRINGEFGIDGWQPIHYGYRSLDRAELVAHYLAASVALVTPLRDGMNLVAAEFVASRIDGGGVLVLSEFAGISEVVDGAVLVNPNDVDALATAVSQALAMPADERRERMDRLRPRILSNSAQSWAGRCLGLGSPREAARPAGTTAVGADPWATA
ncbi:MAG TPA: trehalose-6-phosphate synthase [Candidatus Polarisedimenticolaceae bacterium]|nr:trehalose-6-phosphate synthase [Candidatus Polarisedimenticolaceae bacterium]